VECPLGARSLLAHIFYCLFLLFTHKVKMSLLYLWFSALGYIVTVFHLELFLCLHVRLICALNYYLLKTSAGTLFLMLITK